MSTTNETNSQRADGTVRPMVGPLEPVRFKVQELPYPIEWDVSIEDDGTLVVCAVGRRPGRILVEPSSNQMIRIKTNVIVRRSNNRSSVSGPAAGTE